MPVSDRGGQLKRKVLTKTGDAAGMLQKGVSKEKWRKELSAQNLKGTSRARKARHWSAARKTLLTITRLGKGCGMIARRPQRVPS